LRSASWGLGQTMGNLAQALGFASAREMVAHQAGSIDGQIDCMVRELRRSHLIEPMNACDWSHVARLYNGPGYAANRYDTRLADAFKRWMRRLDTMAAAPREVPPEQSLSVDEVRDIQGWLRANGYPQVGLPDGHWGASTIGAVSAFQAHEGLPVTGHYDQATRDALTTAEARPVLRERGDADAGDLKEAGSTTIEHADHVTAMGSLLKWLGIGGAASAGADNSGALDKVKSGVDQLGALRDLFGTVSDLAGWAVAHWWIFALGAGVFIAAKASKIIAARVDDHRTGVHAGP